MTRAGLRRWRRKAARVAAEEAERRLNAALEQERALHASNQIKTEYLT